MRFALDHVVIAVGDLEQAIADYRSLGFTVTPGGRHPGRTSHNALIAFEDGAYIELIAWTAPNDAERWNVMHRKHGDGFMDYALMPEDVPRAVAQAKGRDLAFVGPLDGGRVRPDGVELKWQTARQPTFDLPFFCGDVTPRPLRVPEGEVRRHANGALGVATLVVAVQDLEASVTRYRAMMGNAGGRVPNIDLSGTGLRTATHMLDGSAIVLAALGAAPSSNLAEVIAARRASHGEGPCALSIRTKAGLAGTVLDSGASHGAHIELC